MAHEEWDDASLLPYLIVGGSALPGCNNRISPATATATVAVALELGCRHFDTAPHYALGLGEERLGAALAAYQDDEKALAKSLKVWTKVGRVIVMSGGRAAVPPSRAGSVEEENCPGAAACIFPDAPRDRVPLIDYSGDGVRKSVEGSLARLGKGLPRSPPAGPGAAGAAADSAMAA